MALHALPAAARGDRHLLVVVTSGTAGSECIIEPEAIFRGDRVRDVRKGRRALVGRDHEIRIVAVATHSRGRRHDAIADDVVGDVQQAADEGSIALDDFALYFVAAASRQAFRYEAALGAHRHDYSVLHVLGLHQAQHFGAKILAPVRPANTAARDVAHAQVHAFDARAVDEDLEHRARQRQIGNLRRIELEGEVGLRLSLGVQLEVIGTQRRLDDGGIRTQDAIFVEALHASSAVSICFCSRVHSFVRRPGVSCGSNCVRNSLSNNLLTAAFALSTCSM